MARRKRVLLCPCVVIVATFGVVIWTNEGASKPSLHVTFIGYTNWTLPGGVTEPSGVFRVTNTGPIAVCYWGMIPEKGPTNDYDGEPNMVTVLNSAVGSHDWTWTPPILRPGSCLINQVGVSPKMGSWSVELSFGSWTFRERVCAWVSSRGNPTVQRLVNKMAPSSKISTITFGPITNQIPTNILALPKPSIPKPFEP